jgi:NTE family protein
VSDVNLPRRRLLALPGSLALASLPGCAGLSVPTAEAVAGEAGAAGAAEPAGPLPGAGPAPRVALALSSGGLRGIAHVGVLRELEAAGLRPDLVVGTSIGALVGACWACGLDSARLAQVSLPAALDPWGSWWTSPAARMTAYQRFVAGLIGHRPIETMSTRFVAVAAERNTGRLQLFGRGDAVRAVAASSALPGALAPVVVGGRQYMDGGLVAPLPVRVARALGAHRVIAVDTTFHAEPEVPPGLFDSVFHAGMVMARHLAAPDRDSADLVIDPVLPPVPQVRLENAAVLVEAGALAARRLMPRISALWRGAAPLAS